MRGIPERDEWSEVTRKLASKRPVNRSVLWFGVGEKMILHSTLYPRWPLQCQGWCRDTNMRHITHQCTRRAAAGNAYCPSHLHDKMHHLVSGTRRYLMWVLAGAPEINQAKPLVDLITIEGVTTELLRRERPVVSDSVRLEAATLLLKTTQWLTNSRARENPKRALSGAGFDAVQVEVAYDALHKAGWLPEVFET